MSRLTRGEEEASVKWISASQSSRGPTLHVDESVDRSIFRPLGDKLVGLISIFGAARQGKSFLMNCLAKKSDLFRISNEKESCTQGIMIFLNIKRLIVGLLGIDISRHFMNLSDFSDEKKPSSTSSIKIGFVDAEGQGDKDTTYDANLVCPILLASKCVIFNWKDSLQKDRILQLLGVMHKAAINVAEEGEIEVSGGVEKIFGHLHVVFRDWQYVNSTPESVKSDLFKEERSADTDARLRNAIRNDIKNSFESITVWLFPSPVSSSSKLTNKLRVDELSEAFKAQLQALRSCLGTQLSHPMKFAGRPFTAKTLGPLVMQIVYALNSGEAVRPMSAYLNMLKDEIDKQRLQAEDIIRSITNKFLATIKLSVENLSAECMEFPPQDQILSKYMEETDLVLNLFAEETADALNAMGTEMSKAVQRDTSASLKSVRQNGIDKLKADFSSATKAVLTLLQQNIESSLETGIKSIEDNQLPMEEADLASKLQQIFDVSIASLHRLQLDRSGVDEIRSSTTKFFNLRADNCKKENKLLLQRSVSVAEAVKQSAIRSMQSFYEEKSAIYYAKAKGFHLTELLLELNNKYTEIEKNLKDEITKTTGQHKAMVSKCVTELKAFCESLSKDMDRRYREHLNFVHGNLLTKSQALLQSQISSLTNLDTLPSDADRALNQIFNDSLDQAQTWSHIQYDSILLC